MTPRHDGRETERQREKEVLIINKNALRRSVGVRTRILFYDPTCYFAEEDQNCHKIFIITTKFLNGSYFAHRLAHQIPYSMWMRYISAQVNMNDSFLFCYFSSFMSTLYLRVVHPFANILQNICLPVCFLGEVQSCCALPSLQQYYYYYYVCLPLLMYVCAKRLLYISFYYSRQSVSTFLRISSSSPT